MNRFNYKRIIKQLVASITWILLCHCTNSTNFKTGLEGKVMPSISLMLMDSTSQINTSNISNGKPTVFFFFTPICPYCRAQIHEIVNNKSFRNINLYLISAFPFEKVKSYYTKTELFNYSNLIVAHDFKGQFINYFKPMGVPYMAFYNGHKQLKQVLMGKTNQSTIVKLIKE